MNFNKTVISILLMNMKYVLFFIFLSALSACASYSGYPNQDQYYIQFKGMTIQQIIYAKGVPTRRDSDGGSGEVLTYEKNGSILVPYKGVYVNSNFTDFAEFFCDSQGICRNIRYGRR